MTEIQQLIVSTAYFPPVRYFSALLKCKTVFIEKHENYIKQSYRNRFEIMSPNGKQTLSIPVIKKSGEKQLITDVKIDYKNDWQSLHLKSLQTAYLSSPFYEFYIDAFMTFFKNKYTFLFDFNLEIIHTLFSELQIKKNIKFTENYVIEYKSDDYRNAIHPKKNLQEYFPKFQVKKYTQVFSDKFEFIPNLSILDLLFNEGPDAESFLI